MKKILFVLVIILMYILCFLTDIKVPKEYSGAPEIGYDSSYSAKMNTPKPKKLKEEEQILPSKASNGKLKLYFINPLEYDSPSLYPRTEYCKLLADEIKNAKSSIDFAIYGIDNQNEIQNALKKASLNVKIRGVSDSDEFLNPTYADMAELKKYFDIRFDNSKYIMHDKFFVFDNKKVFTGSMNISSTGCGGYNANTVAVIENDEIALAYKKEFEQMQKGVFKKDKKDYSLENIKLTDGTILSVYFSPKGDIYNKVIHPMLASAKQKIRVSIFVLTHKGIIEDLINAKKRGADVLVIADALGANNYKNNIELLRNAGIKVKVENWGGKNHEKTIMTDDKNLLIGSVNFSYNAIYRNDENAVLIQSAYHAKRWAKFFDTLYKSIDDVYLTKIPLSESKESINSCFDKIDNDFDGDIDSADSSCHN